MNKRQMIPIVIVIAIGAILGGLILTWDKTDSPNTPHQDHDKADSSHTPDHPETRDAPAADKSMGFEPGKGPKGGKYYTKGKFGGEVTTFEKGETPTVRSCP